MIPCLFVFFNSEALHMVAGSILRDAIMIERPVATIAIGVGAGKQARGLPYPSIKMKNILTIFLLVLWWQNRSAVEFSVPESDLTAMSL